MDVPTISVGNLAVGGTGKTPVVDHIGRILTDAGKKVAVVSRGYGRKRIAEDRVVSGGNGPEITPELAGDEPYLLARRNPCLVILAARRRRFAVERAVREFGAEAVILDDGFQHLAVGRHLDMVLLDGRRPLGNGRVLPAGPLREFSSALKRGDLFVFTRWEEESSPFPVPGPTLHCRHVLNPTALSLAGVEKTLASLSPLKGAAFAGIAEPERFFQDLYRSGLTLERCLPFADHVRYGEREMAALRTLAEGVDYLVTTEKDGVKLQGSEFPVPCYEISLGVEFREPEALKRILFGLFGPEGEDDAS
jgi:tetraacyldisaccharide 4'-kinase